MITSIINLFLLLLLPQYTEVSRYFYGRPNVKRYINVKSKYVNVVIASIMYMCVLYTVTPGVDSREPSSR